MSHLDGINGVTLNIHAMPCTNGCRHCWTQGSARNPRMPFERVAFVLQELARLKEHVPGVESVLPDLPLHKWAAAYLMEKECATR